MNETRVSENFVRKRPYSDAHDRDVFGICGFINHQNPKAIVGSVILHAGRVLLCRRAIEPRTGFWTLTAGYLENGETVEEGVIRDAGEEACVAISIDRVLVVSSLARNAQLQIIHVATLAQARFAAGPESFEVTLLERRGLPWSELAFPSVSWALKHAFLATNETHTLPFKSAPLELQ